jgi:CheY-like chemotaxis protein
MARVSKKVETENLEELKHYYQEVIRCMPNLVYVVDKHCVLQMCNDNMLTLLGIERVDDLQETLYSRLIQHTHYSKNRIDMLKRDDINALLSGQSQRDVAEPPILGQQDNIIYYLANRTLLFNKNKQVQGMVVILTDISERKKMEEQFEKIREKLQELNSAKSKSVTYPPQVQRSPMAPPKILMVEDNIIAQKAAQALLLQLDCQVDVADSIKEALALFKPGKYDIVFMDIGLQDASGYLVSKKIRQAEANSGYRVPIIALTGYEADVVMADCNEYFMEGAITKPLSSEQARQIIERYIHNIDIPIRGLKSISRAQ